MNEKGGARVAHIGIVVPVYKTKREYLDACVASLTGQTYRDIQIVLVDDGSPDECGAWCEEYARFDPRIAVVHHAQNRGLPAARNSGLARLDAQWVTFVDSDDWVEAQMCEKLAGHLRRWTRTPDMVIFSGYRNYPRLEVRSAPAYEGETWFESPEAIEQLQIYALSYLRRDYPSRALNLDSACWRLLRVDYLRRKGIAFVDLPYREDGLFFLHTTEQAERIVYIYETFYHYRSTGNSMVNMYRPRADAEHARYLGEVWRFVDEFHKKQAFAHRMYDSVLLSMQICITQKFFHPANPHSFWQRQRACGAYFRREPYASLFQKLPLWSLRRNHLLKALLIRLRLYAGVSGLRSLYMRLSGKDSYD